MPGIAAPHGLAAALGVALALGVDVVVDEGALDVLVDGDPHGLGMAAPVDPSRVLLGLLEEAVEVLPPPIWASMRGS